MLICAIEILNIIIIIIIIKRSKRQSKPSLKFFDHQVCKLIKYTNDNRPAEVVFIAM